MFAFRVACNIISCYVHIQLLIVNRTVLLISFIYSLCWLIVGLIGKMRTHTLCIHIFLILFFFRRFSSLCRFFIFFCFSLLFFLLSRLLCALYIKKSNKRRKKKKKNNITALPQFLSNCIQSSQPSRVREKEGRRMNWRTF